ncbi:per-hexamer repeat protein 5, putative, partial [Trypanosoma cruzi marinkellei]
PAHIASPTLTQTEARTGTPAHIASPTLTQTEARTGTPAHIASPTLTQTETRTGTPTYTATPTLTHTKKKTATVSLTMPSPEAIPDDESRVNPTKIILIICSILIMSLIFIIVVLVVRRLRRKKWHAGNRTCGGSVGSSHDGVQGASNPLSGPAEFGAYQIVEEPYFFPQTPVPPVRLIHGRIPQTASLGQPHFYPYMPAPPVRLSEGRRPDLLSEGNREAFRSIRMHQSNYMDLDEATRFHLLRHAETAYVEFGPFLDSDSD